MLDSYSCLTPMCVCVRGDLASRDSSPLRGLDGRPCAISLLSTAENYESPTDTGTVTDRTLQQVPWCLTSYDSKSPKIVMDQEAVRQALNAAPPPADSVQACSVLNDVAMNRQHECGYLRKAGVETPPRTWWTLLTLQPQKTLVSHILPVLTQCSMIGAITLNTDGDYLLTVHPKFGFFLFSDIAFGPMAAAHRAAGLQWGQLASGCGLARSGLLLLSFGLLALSWGRGGALSRALWPFSAAEERQRRERRGRRRDPSQTAPRSGDGPSSQHEQGCSGGNMNMCVICLSEPRSVLARPCLHLCLCLSCYQDNYLNDDANAAPTHAHAARRARGRGRECPICRDAIESYEVIYNP